MRAGQEQLTSAMLTNKADRRSGVCAPFQSSARMRAMSSGEMQGAHGSDPESAEGLEVAS